ncbi:MAG TPA: diaminopimelate epimerase [Burkholderiaceae bacterium]|nr:diaminopimelate epimerase [Burkholderiaceae bacterium]
MRLPFTKMQGAGNDFVVLDATRAPLELTPAQVQRLGDRRFGIGADQILVVEPSPAPGVDFGYRIYNGFSGDEVEHCGNGARCFVRYVRDKGLTDKTRVRVKTVNNLLELQWHDDGRVTVDMNAPIFEHERLPFDATGLTPRREGGFELWPLQLNWPPGGGVPPPPPAGATPTWERPGVGFGVKAEVAVLSMGNPHAVMRVDDVASAPVAVLGPQIEGHARFPRRVNAGFMQVLSRHEIALRVHERGAGETLACGTGACAAVVAGVRLGWLDARVDVRTRGGLLTIEWAGGDAHVLMTGPAESVFEGEIEL